MKRIEIAMTATRGSRLSLFDEPEAGIDLWSFQSLLLELFIKTALNHQDPGNLFVLLGAVSGLR